MRTLLALALLSHGVATLALAPNANATAHDTTGGPRSGTRLVYSLYYSNASIADLASLAGGTKSTGVRTEPAPPPISKSFTTSLKGSLVVTVLRVDPSETLLALSWQDLDIAISYNDVKATSDEERIHTALSHDVYAAVTSEGKIVRLEFTPDVDATSQGCVRAVLGGLQFVTPPAPTLPNSWDTEEEDPNGIFLAHYEASATHDTSASSQAFTKKKLKYLARSQSHGSKVTAVPLTIVPDCETHLRRDFATGHLLSVRATEHQVISLSGRTLADSKSELTLILTSSNALTESERGELTRERDRLSSTFLATSLYETRRDKATEDRRRRHIVGNATTENLVESLTAIDTGTTSDQAKTELAERLEALFLLRPESCSAFQTILNTSARGGTAFRLLAVVLSRVGHAEAQAVLRDALETRREEKPALVLLIHSLSSLEAPGTETETTLRELAFGSGDSRIANSAQLALGTLASHLAKTEPHRAAEIVKEIAGHIESSRASETKSRLLSALGNARTAEATAVVQCYLDSPNADLREAALPVILRLQPDRADEVLTKHLAGDSSESVRLASARELATRTATAATFDVQKKVFLEDAATSVRAMLLGSLWQARATFPEGAALVRNAAKQDSSPEVRQMAEKLMTNSSPST